MPAPSLPMHSSRRPLLLLIVLMIFAAVVRVLGTRNDLWLDEIFSLSLALHVKSVTQIFRLHIDNNHYLNTLYMYLLGLRHYWPVYRYFSVACGIALVPTGYWLLAKRSRAHAIFFAAMLAVSYPLIHFSSEARGNSPGLLGALLAAAALANFLTRPRLSYGILYSVAITFAFLSHLTALAIWGPLALWSLCVLLYRARRSPRRLILSLPVWLLLNLLPLLVFAFLYQEDLRYFSRLGGPQIPIAFAITRFLALTVGWTGPDAAAMYFLLFPLATLALWQLFLLFKNRDSLFLLFIFIFSVPAISLSLYPPQFFFARYLLIEAPFIYWLLTLAIFNLCSQNRARIAPWILLAIFFAAQLFLYANFLEVGRGQFLAAFDLMVGHTRSQVIDVTSNQDLRANMEIPFYSLYLPQGRSINYVPQSDQDLLPADWYILHGEGYEPSGPPAFTLEGQPTWYRAAFFPASELSGQAWTLYCHVQTEKPNP